MFIFGCLLIQPITVFSFLALQISISVDFILKDLQIFRSFLVLYMKGDCLYKSRYHQHWFPLERFCNYSLEY